MTLTASRKVTRDLQEWSATSCFCRMTYILTGRANQWQQFIVKAAKDNFVTFFVTMLDAWRRLGEVFLGSGTQNKTAAWQV